MNDGPVENQTVLGDRHNPLMHFPMLLLHLGVGRKGADHDVLPNAGILIYDRPLYPAAPSNAQRRRARHLRICLILIEIRPHNHRILDDHIITDHASDSNHRILYLGPLHNTAIR